MGEVWPLEGINWHLKADFHFLTLEQGGDVSTSIYTRQKLLLQVRYHTFQSGHLNSSLWSVAIHFDTDQDWIFPGECVPCYLAFPAFEVQKSVWKIGMEFFVVDFRYRIASCIVTEVI